MNTQITVTIGMESKPLFGPLAITGFKLRTHAEQTGTVFAAALSEWAKAEAWHKVEISEGD